MERVERFSPHRMREAASFRHSMRDAPPRTMSAITCLDGKLGARAPISYVS
jgi:hypothetical protein